VDEFARLSWIYDEPVGEAPAIPTYLMCRRAKQHVTVMLCGEGADEIFGATPSSRSTVLALPRLDA
jgi:asparagine synthase (glutamine-hydrolysing)